MSQFNSDICIYDKNPCIMIDMSDSTNDKVNSNMTIFSWILKEMHSILKNKNINEIFIYHKFMFN